jgi:predicted peptidase
LTSLVEPALRELRAIIVAPDCNGSDWTQSNSEQDVLELLDHVEAAYNIDPNKTLITGYSMGDIGTWPRTTKSGSPPPCLE